MRDLLLATGLLANGVPDAIGDWTAQSTPALKPSIAPRMARDTLFSGFKSGSRHLPSHESLGIGTVFPLSRAQREPAERSRQMRGLEGK